jgi:hypothetical protein
MIAILKLFDGSIEPTGELQIPVTIQGIPILPSVGDFINIKDSFYRVSKIVWNYDAQTIVVLAHCS